MRFWIPQKHVLKMETTYLKNMQNQGYVQENQKRNSSSGTVSMGRQRKDSMTLEDSGKNLLKLEEQEFVRSANSLVANVDRNQAPVFAPDNNNTVALVGTVVSTEETHQEMNVKKIKKKCLLKKVKVVEVEVVKRLIQIL